MEAGNTITAFRAAHIVPLKKATNGLRSMVRTEKCLNSEISQRLKRMTSILRKLDRKPRMAPASMYDIGGCRAVLVNIDELRRVEKRLAKNRPPLAKRDYIVNPQTSGYRSLHMMVEYDSRCIEVQLGTPNMHAWAVTVERLGGRLDFDLKASIGPEPVLSLLRAASEAMALEEAGKIVDTRLAMRIGQLQKEVAPLLQEGSL